MHVLFLSIIRIPFTIAIRTPAVVQTVGGCCAEIPLIHISENVKCQN